MAIKEQTQVETSYDIITQQTINIDIDIDISGSIENPNNIEFNFCSHDNNFCFLSFMTILGICLIFFGLGFILYLTIFKRY